MALTATQRTAVRRHAGYPAGAAAATDAVAVALAGLVTEEEAVITTTFLPSLTLMELGITNSLETIDTKQAAVWHRNTSELVERMAMYRAQRVALCRFLGIVPGQGILDMALCWPAGCAGAPGAGTVVPGGGAVIVGGIVQAPAVLVV